MACPDPAQTAAFLIAHMDRLRLERSARHIHRLGPRAVAEVLVELAGRTDAATVLAVVRSYEPLSLAMLAAAGGDRFPPRPLRQVVP